MFTLPTVNAVLLELANEFALIAVFLLGWFFFRYAPVQRFFGKDDTADKAAEKAMAADLASGQPHLVVAQGKALARPSEDAVHLVASALIELDAQAIPGVCSVMCAKSRLSLDVVVGVVLAATPAALAAEALDTLLAALQKLGATVDPAQHCRALTDRGVPGLAARFGDLAQRVHLEALAEAPVPDPSALLAAFRAASHSADALFARVLPLLGERAAELLPEQPQLVHALSAEEIADLLTQLPADTALALLQCWRAGGHKATAGMVAHLSQAGQPVAELAAADGVALPGPDAGRVRQAMGALRKCTDAATAEQVCQSLQPCPVIVSNMALQVCVSRDLATARRLFAATAEKDVITYNTLLKGEAQAGAWDAVRKLLAEMTERVTPNHVTFNTLLHACVAQKASPWAFVTAMEQQGLAPDAITVTTLLRAVAGPADAAHLRRCLTYVEAVSGTDAGLFDALFDACSRARARDLLASALDMAQRAGVQTERAFVNLLRTAASLEEAWSLWKDLASPASPEYSQMAQTLTQLGALEDARDLCAKARQSGHMVSASASAQLIKALCARKDVASASAVSEQLMAGLRAGAAPLALAHFNALLDAWSRVGAMDRADELWNAAQELGVTPDLISFSSLVKGYCVLGNLEQALAIFGQLRRRGLRPDAILFHSILDGCANREMVELAEQIYQDMVRDGHKPTNITLSILVKLYGRTSYERARDTFDELPAVYGFTPNAQVFTCLMSVALTHRNVPEALRAKRDMEEAGIRPDAKCFQTLLKGCLRLQALEEAVAVAEDAAACGVALDAGLLQDLVFVLERRAPDLARRFGPKLAGAPRGPADARRPAPAAGARFQRRA